MNDGHSRSLSCGAKVRYGTAASARQAKAWLPYGKNLDVYACVYCRGFHLGTTTKHSDARRSKRCR